MRVYELRALQRLPAASMLPAGSRHAPPKVREREAAVAADMAAVGL